MIDKFFDFVFDVMPNWLIYMTILAFISALMYFYIDTLTKAGL